MSKIDASCLFCHSVGTLSRNSCSSCGTTFPVDGKRINYKTWTPVEEEPETTELNFMEEL